MYPNVALIRHAYTYWNGDPNRSGYTNELDNLTLRGIIQSLQLSPEIYALIMAYSWRVRVYCSESRRTLQTAIFAWVWHLPIYRDSRLNEFEADGGFRSIINTLTRREKQLPPSLMEVQQRMMDFLQSLDPTYCNIAFSHGASIATAYHAVDPNRTHIPGNATINLFGLHNGTLTLH